MRCVVALVALLGLVHTTTAATACFHLGDCNGHGTCDTTNARCDCFDGWGSVDDISLYKAADCSQRTCPADNAWIDIPTSATSAHAQAECSNMGVCDRTTGQCRCFAGFEGDACQRSVCPNACSGHGKCVSISQMATESDALPANVNTNTYGGDEAATTWDENKVFGCVCDSSVTVGLASGETQEGTWFGPDCSQKHCPSGDDPMTDADETDCENLFQNGSVDNTAVITTDKGAAGNLCHVDCANRGICDHSTGLCGCFSGFFGEACTLRSALAPDRSSA